MKRHEKINAVPEHLRSMKKRIMQSLALVGILIMTLSLSGCEKLVETDVSAETKSATISETITANENTKETLQTEKDNYEYEELPKGWSAEQILNIISIDGYQLSIPCSIDDILSLSDDFQVNDETYCNENEKIAFLFYKNIELGSIAYDNNKIINYISLYGYSESDFIYIDNIEIHDTEKIVEIMQTLIKEHHTNYFYGKFIDKNTNKKIVIAYQAELGDIIICIV